MDIWASPFYDSPTPQRPKNDFLEVTPLKAWPMGISVMSCTNCAADTWFLILAIEFQVSDGPLIAWLHILDVLNGPWFKNYCMRSIIKIQHQFASFLVIPKSNRTTAFPTGIAAFAPRFSAARGIMEPRVACIEQSLPRHVVRWWSAYYLKHLETIWIIYISAPSMEISWDILHFPPERRGGITMYCTCHCSFHTGMYDVFFLDPYGSTVFNTFRCRSSGCNLSDPPASWCFSLSWQPWLQCQPMRCTKQECFVENQVVLPFLWCHVMTSSYIFKV